MKASETSVRILLEGSKQFQIPLFQRPYSWSKKQWDALWEDLLEVYNEAEDYHFLGPLVTQSVPGTPDGVSPFDLIDGQQRLTTLSILLAALRDHLKEHDSDSAAELHELYLINRFKKGEARYKILPTQADQEVYKQVIEGQMNGDKSIISEAYKFFWERMKNSNSEEDTVSIDITKLKNIVLENITLVSITLDDRDNPYIIFESLNHRGEPLTQADLIRNYFFMRLTDKNQKEIVYKKIWLPLQDEFKKNAGEEKYLKELTRAFWCYLRREGVATSENKIYQELKSRLDQKSEHEVLSVIKEFAQLATYYIRISFPENNEKNSGLRRAFERLKELNFRNCHPLLLNLYRDYENKTLSLQQFEQALGYVESYFVRRLFGDLSVQLMNKIFTNLYKDVNKRLEDKKSSNFVIALREELASFDTNNKGQVWPDDNSFRKSIIENSVNVKDSRVKFLLASLQEPLTKFQVKTEDLTLEHIMPQKLTPAWRALLGVNAEEISKNWLHTLGNLTLTPPSYNSEMSNSPFSKKLEYLQKSALTLDNQYFKNVETWNAEAIRCRAEYLANIAVKVWPR